MKSFYRTYLALRLHFTTDDYDIIKYNCKLKCSLKGGKIAKQYLESFQRKYKEDELIEYMVANFVKGDKYGGLFDPEGESNYIKWKGRIQSITYLFKKDINIIRNNVNYLEDLFNIDGIHPKIMKLYLGKHIMPETCCILETVYGYTNSLDEKLKGDFMWDNFRRLVCKYQPFLRIERNKYEDIVKSKFAE